MEEQKKKKRTPAEIYLKALENLRLDEIWDDVVRDLKSQKEGFPGFASLHDNGEEILIYNKGGYVHIMNKSEGKIVGVASVPISVLDMAISVMASTLRHEWQLGFLVDKETVGTDSGRHQSDILDEEETNMEEGEESND